jgi:hypothetical protein
LASLAAAGAPRTRTSAIIADPDHLADHAAGHDDGVAALESGDHGLVGFGALLLGTDQQQVGHGGDQGEHAQLRQHVGQAAARGRAANRLSHRWCREHCVSKVERAGHPKRGRLKVGGS